MTLSRIESASFVKFFMIKIEMLGFLTVAGFHLNSLTEAVPMRFHISYSKKETTLYEISHGSLSLMRNPAQSSQPFHGLYINIFSLPV